MVLGQSRAAQIAHVLVPETLSGSCSWKPPRLRNVGSSMASVHFDGAKFGKSAVIRSGAARAMYRGTAMGVRTTAATPTRNHGLFAGGVESNADVGVLRVTRCVGSDLTRISTYPGHRPAVSSVARLTGAAIRLEDGAICDGNSTFMGDRITVQSTPRDFPVRHSPGSCKRRGKSDARGRFQAATTSTDLFGRQTGVRVGAAYPIDHRR